VRLYGLGSSRLSPLHTQSKTSPSMQLICMAMGRDTHAPAQNMGSMLLATLLAVGALQVADARFPPPANAQSWVGQARVVDGDTL
jgi:hypothetical protein